MPLDPQPPESSLSDRSKSDLAVESHPLQADVAGAQVQSGAATKSALAQSGPLTPPAKPDSWSAGNAPVILWFVALITVSALLACGLQFAGKRLISSLATHTRESASVTSASNPTAQSEAEGLLARVAAGDSAAAEQVLAQSESWVGKTRRTPRANQLITVALDLHDMRARQAAIQADLAMDGIPQNVAGLAKLKRAAGNHDQRAWALWSMGGLGNRGVDPSETAKTIEAYLDDPDASVRVAAVNGLAILGTDETVSVLLDRFHNDPSAVVQEQAACGLAESGMYTHEQRMVAAGGLVGWLNDSQLTAQQRNWTVHALQDISGQNFGMDQTAWQHWYDSSR